MPRCPPALLDTWQARGVSIIQGYGFTEASPNVLCLPPEDARRKAGSAGKPYPHVAVGLRELETGAQITGPGEGEIVVAREGWEETGLSGPKCPNPPLPN